MEFKRKVKQQKFIFRSEGPPTLSLRNFSPDNNCYSWITVNYFNSYCRPCCRLSALNWLRVQHFTLSLVKQWNSETWETCSQQVVRYANSLLTVLCDRRTCVPIPPRCAAHLQIKYNELKSVTFQLMKFIINLTSLPSQPPDSGTSTWMPLGTSP